MAFTAPDRPGQDRGDRARGGGAAARGRRRRLRLRHRPGAGAAGRRADGLLGVSAHEAHELISLTRRMIAFRDPNLVGASADQDERLRLAGIQADIFEFFADFVRARSRPGDGAC
jgi:hypothetical protein